MIAAESTLKLGLVKMDFITRRTYIGDFELKLRNKEFILLAYFLRNPGRIITRVELIEEVWDQNISWPTNTVDVHISILRSRLKDYFGRSLIKTVHCVGYIFDF